MPSARDLAHRAPAANAARRAGLRVLVVTTDYPPHREGGYELHCRAAVEHLRRHGHHVRVLTSDRGLRPSAAAQDAAAGVHRDLVRYGLERTRRPAGAAWHGERVNATALARHLRTFRPDVVSLWRLGELPMSIPRRVRRAGVPAVGMVCDPWMLTGPHRDPWTAATGRDPRLGTAARWLFVSEALRREVLDGGVDLPDSGVVHAGVHLDHLPLRPARPWQGRLLYAGRLSPLKGVDTAIRALAQCPPGTSLDVVGEGPADYVQELRELAAGLGLADRVVLRGARPPERMAAVYAGADAVLFPARWEEPFGLVPLEAMACGVPVVASGTGGSAEYLVDGANALVAGRDAEPRAYAAAVERLAGDPDLRAALRRAGRVTAEAFPMAASVAAVREELEAAAAAPARFARTTAPSARDAAQELDEPVGVRVEGERLAGGPGALAGEREGRFVREQRGQLLEPARQDAGA